MLLQARVHAGVMRVQLCILVSVMKATMVPSASVGSHKTRVWTPKLRYAANMVYSKRSQLLKFALLD